MVEDISQKTLFVLVILTLLISVLGTWTVLSQINSGPAMQQPAPGSQTAHVQVNIEPPQQSPEVTGKVVFEIQQPK